MGEQGTSRRSFLKHTGVALSASWLSLHAASLMAAAAEAKDKAAQGAGYEHIPDATARILEAVADQIWPEDDTPGARELGAVHFMDFAVGGFMAGAWPMIEAGAREIDLTAQANEGMAFAELPFEAQTALLKAHDASPFFGAVHFLTLMGCFSLPEYGGNIDGQGWAQLGFESRHVWNPPFGHYDAEYGKEATDERA